MYYKYGQLTETEMDDNDLDYLGECDDKQYKEGMSQYMLRCDIKSELSKASKETARQILQDLKDMTIIPEFTLHLILNTISQKYGVEVEL